MSGASKVGQHYWKGAFTSSAIYAPLVGQNNRVDNQESAIDTPKIHARGKSCSDSSHDILGYGWIEEKLMKRMAVVHRKAEELRAAARQQHTEQIEKATEHAQKMMNMNRLHSHFSKRASCGCFPCNNNHQYRS